MLSLSVLPLLGTLALPPVGAAAGAAVPDTVPRITVLAAPAAFEVPGVSDFFRGHVDGWSPVVIDVDAAPGFGWELCARREAHSSLPGEARWLASGSEGTLGFEPTPVVSGSGSERIEVDLRAVLRWALHGPGAYDLSVRFSVHESGTWCQWEARHG